MSKTIRARSEKSPKSHKASAKRHFNKRIRTWLDWKTAISCKMHTAVIKEKVVISNQAEIDNFIEANKEIADRLKCQVRNNIRFVHRDRNYNRKRFNKEFRQFENAKERQRDKAEIFKAVQANDFDGYSCKHTKSWQFFD